MALGVETGSTETLNKVVLASTATCPTLRMSLCELESYRKQSPAGNEALCTDNCTEDDLIEIKRKRCSAVEDQHYPTDL